MRSIARRWAIVSTHAIPLPRFASNFEACCQISRKTSCVTSSDWARSRSRRVTSPITREEMRSYTSANAVRLPAATSRRRLSIERSSSASGVGTIASLAPPA